MPLLEVKGASKRFGGVSALSAMDFKMNEGEIVGLIGPNGAGKTSFFNCLTGLLPLDKGTIFFKDARFALHRLPPHRIAEAGLARTFQNLRIFKNMTLLENVSIGFHARRFSERKIFEESDRLLDFMGLQAQSREIAANLPYGSQKRLEIARALACGPSLLLLDEPVAGMNANEKEEIIRLIRDIRSRGMAVLIIEHDMNVVMPLSDRVMVMDEGAKIAEGKPEEIRSDKRVIEAYLGEM
ncbi:MAG: ABC transporter ATP-binding protein [Candidatus Omnitrophica bacterium]|nr:ABC transporter ATP-binding protein [Candidatus Omnitrophota bacterium]